MRVRIDSIGCRLNIGEADELARTLAARGHRVVGPGDVADVMVFNSCAVTHVASRKSRKLIRHWRRSNPGAAIVVTGCYAELSPDAVDRLGVDLVVGNHRKDELAAVLEDAGLLADRQALPAPDGVPLRDDTTAAATGPGARTRAFIKVQDGCDNKCTFCIVTVARGEGRSRAAEEIVAQIRELATAGFQEAVLSGVHLGSYGHDQGQARGLFELVQRVLDETPIARLRLSSLEPWDLGGDFFTLWERDDRLQPHVHLPLQSGCDRTLQRMARRTTRNEFRHLVSAARARVPDLAVTTDIIVGFPGESDAEFEESLGFVEEIDFARLHVFRYSPRRATAAAAMPGRVSPQLAQQRSQRMHALGAAQEARFRQRFVGRTLPVLWESVESRLEGVRWSGLTGSYVRVVADTSERVDLRNRITDAAIVGELPGALSAEARFAAAPAARAG